MTEIIYNDMHLSVDVTHGFYSTVNILREAAQSVVQWDLKVLELMVPVVRDNEQHSGVASVIR